MYYGTGILLLLLFIIYLFSKVLYTAATLHSKCTMALTFIIIIIYYLFILKSPVHSSNLT